MLASIGSPGGTSVVKLIALYKKPPDPSLFDRYYRDTHMPLVRKWPGLRKVELGRITGRPGGSEPAYYLIAWRHSIATEQCAASSSPAMNARSLPAPTSTSSAAQLRCRCSRSTASGNGSASAGSPIRSSPRSADIV